MDDATATFSADAGPAGKTIRILILEDVATDVELIERVLRKDGLVFATRCVAGAPEFRAALERFKPDIVLSDYSLPGFDGLAAVRIVRESWPDLPFILVTGVLEDEDAVAVVKAGANDYVRKDRLPRLPLAVRRALADAEGARRQRQADRQIIMLARTDTLTGLANRVALLDRLRESFAVARRSGPKFAVFYLDLDHFKDVNDTLGHPIGDNLLATVADRLRESVRETDLVARLGGDEFSVLQSNVREPSDAGTLAAKLLKSLSAPFHLDGGEVHISASIGISVYQPGLSLAEDMLGQADLALYRAKAEGRDQYCFHSPELDAEVRERVKLSEELRLALEREEFELYYQPQVAQPDGRIVGLEALVRWHHPRRGLLPAAAFLPIAEKLGIMRTIGDWVLQTVCRQITEWREAGIPLVTVAINLSAAQLKASADFEKNIVAALAQWHIPPEMLEFELSESALTETARDNDIDLHRIGLLGLKLVVDGFGVGSLSLDHIGTFGFARLKIAPRFVAGANGDRSSTALVRAAIGLARELGIPVIAGGVEDGAQLAFLAGAGCPVAQGFYICPPTPADRVADLLRLGRIAGAALTGSAVTGAGLSPGQGGSISGAVTVN